MGCKKLLVKHIPDAGSADQQAGKFEESVAVELGSCKKKLKNLHAYLKAEVEVRLIKKQADMARKEWQKIPAEKTRKKGTPKQLANARKKELLKLQLEAEENLAKKMKALGIPEGQDAEPGEKKKKRHEKILPYQAAAMVLWPGRRRKQRRCSETFFCSTGFKLGGSA